MSHPKLVPNPGADSGAAPADSDNVDAADQTTTTKAALTRCCPISREDEFSYRNPFVLGDTLLAASQAAVDAALEGDHERTARSLAYLTERIADAHAYDDHASRHLVAGICSALSRAVESAKYRYANPPTPHDDEYDKCDESTAGTTPHATGVAPSGRIRIHRPRTPAVTAADEHADTTHTTHQAPTARQH